LISWSQSGPAGTVSALVGRENAYSIADYISPLAWGRYDSEVARAKLVKRFVTCQWQWQAI
jgi:hypothetical protein